MVKMSQEKFICDGCKEIKEPDGLEVCCLKCSRIHGCSECNGQWTVRVRNFCDDCDCGFGYDMFCCHECGYEGDEKEFLEIDIDGESLTFCNDKCYKEYVK